MNTDQFLQLFEFLAVLLRAATLISETLVIGGIAFLAVVLRAPDEGALDLRQTSRRWVRASALALAITQAVSVASSVFVLMASAGLSFREAIGANFVFAASLMIAAALAIAVLCSGDRWHGAPALLLPAGLLLVGSVMTSHAVARLNHRALLAALTGLHQGATAAWIGGLPFLVLVLVRARAAGQARETSQRFSRLALGCVTALVIAGLGLSVLYLGSWSSLYETAYGAMVGAKVLLLCFLLVLGASNFFAVRATPPHGAGALTRVRRFCEAEIGIGLTVLLAAASLTSQPPAVDLTADRLSAAEIFARMAPQWPRFTAPSARELAATVHAAPPDSTPADAVRTPVLTHHQINLEWSECNHHWAGLAVFLMGLLALLARTQRFPLARNWPLLFIGMAAFLFFRADPETWPMGPRNFWQSWLDPEDLQHRFFVLLIVAFAVFEWRVQTGRVVSRVSSLVFPALCALAGAALLTHSHSLANLKEDLLAELSHLPIAVAGVMAGWSRWLEIRLPAEDRAKPVLSWVWPVCFVLVGAILLNYREM